MKVRDLIDIIAEYNIVHLNLDETFKTDGFVDYKGKNIYIFHPQDGGDVKDTVVHELLHAYYARNGLTGENRERNVQAKTKELMKKYYGV